MDQDILSQETKAAMRSFISSGDQDFVLGLDDSALADDERRAVAVFVYHLGEREDEKIAECRYGQSVDGAMRSLLTSMDADQTFWQGVGRDRQSGALSYEGLGDIHKRTHDAYIETFTPIGDEALAVKARLTANGDFVVIAEDVSLAPDSDHRYSALLLTLLDSPSFGPPMCFRSGATMHKAVMTLAGAVA